MSESKKNTFIYLIYHNHNEGRTYKSVGYSPDRIYGIIWEINRHVNDSNKTIEGLMDDDGNHYFLEFDKENPWKLFIRKQDDTDKGTLTERQIERELDRYRKEVK